MMTTTGATNLAKNQTQRGTSRWKVCLLGLSDSLKFKWNTKIPMISSMSRLAPKSRNSKEKVTLEITNSVRWLRRAEGPINRTKTISPWHGFNASVAASPPSSTILANCVAMISWSRVTSRRRIRQKSPLFSSWVRLSARRSSPTRSTLGELRRKTQQANRANSLPSCWVWIKTIVRWSKIWARLPWSDVRHSGDKQLHSRCQSIRALWKVASRRQLRWKRKKWKLTVATTILCSNIRLAASQHLVCLKPPLMQPADVKTWKRVRGCWYPKTSKIDLATYANRPIT